MAGIVSLKAIGNWDKQIGVPLSTALAVSMDVCGRSGQKACRHALILMAQSARALAKQAKKNRKIMRDENRQQYLEKHDKSGQIKRWYLPSRTRDPDAYAEALAELRPIGNRGLAKRSWMWGLGDIGKPSKSKRMAGVADVQTILSQTESGYVLSNRLDYITAAMPAGWARMVEMRAGNKIMAQARNRLAKQFKSEMSRVGGRRVAGAKTIDKYFVRAA